MKLMLKIKIIPILLYTMLIVSCNDWLDVEPVGVQTNSTFWQTKEDVEGVVAASYIQLRKSMEHMFMWGELKGNGLKFGNGFKNSSYDEVNQSEIRELNVLPTNKYAEYAELYKGISHANFVLKLGAGAMDYDVTLTQPLMDAYFAEAIFVRSLNYFYLVRTFRDVPYITNAYDTDETDFRVNSSPGDSILRAVLVDLKKYATKCKPGYEIAWQGKGRATSWAFYALIADISLWIGDYNSAIEYCNMLALGSFKLIKMDDWIEVYYPGNSKESIFELNYLHKDKEENQRNSLFSWFDSDGGKFVISDYLNKQFMGIGMSDIDVRGTDWGYLTTDSKVWKYIGTMTNVTENPKSVRPNEERSPNFIFYRYAEILFIKAEAMIMLPASSTQEMFDNISEAFDLLDKTVRKRAGYRSALAVPPYDPDVNTSEAMTTMRAEAIKIIVDERLKEFYGEGKSWFDILRVSRIDGVGIQFMKDCLLPYVKTNERQIKNNDLNDVNSHYLPIHEEEIKAAAGVLKQNPFFQKYTDNI